MHVIFMCPTENAIVKVLNLLHWNAKYFHIGFAVDTPHGLMVPKIRDVDQMSIKEIGCDAFAWAVSFAITMK